MAFFRDPGEMFLGCLGTAEQRFLVTLIQTAAKSGYTRFVEPCAGTFAMANLAVRNGFKPEQIETSDVSMMTSVLGYSLFVWYVMKVPHKTYRLGRLCYMLAQNREFCDTLLDELDREKVTKIRTAMITKYPENKEVRGIMKLCSRAVDKQQGYKLTYEAPIINTRSEKETLTEWLRKEKQWQENRVKTTK